MGRTFMCIAAMLLLAVCLIMGGCSSSRTGEVKSWKDLLSSVPGQTQKQEAAKDAGPAGEPQVNPAVETMDIKLYFLEASGSKLVTEDRTVEKTKSIARKSLEELIKGPGMQQHKALFPPGTRLLDINIKSDQQLCIVDFSSEIKTVSPDQEKYLVYAIANTLGQFPSIKKVSFMVNGQKVNSLAGSLDLSQPVRANYSI